MIETDFRGRRSAAGLNAGVSAGAAADVPVSLLAKMKIRGSGASFPDHRAGTSALEREASVSTGLRLGCSRGVIGLGLIHQLFRSFRINISRPVPGGGRAPWFHE